MWCKNKSIHTDSYFGALRVAMNMVSCFVWARASGKLNDGTIANWRSCASGTCCCCCCWGAGRVTAAISSEDAFWRLEKRDILLRGSFLFDLPEFKLFKKNWVQTELFAIGSYNPQISGWRKPGYVLQGCSVAKKKKLSEVVEQLRNAS